MTRAILAGIIATIFLSLLLIAHDYFGLMPEFRLIAEWEKLLAMVGLPADTAWAWVANTVVGVVFYGVVFAALEPILPGSGLGAGITFGIIAWLVMMLVAMPLLGYGFFAAALGAKVIFGTLLLHLLYGAVLGLSYRLLGEHEEW